MEQKTFNCEIAKKYDLVFIGGGPSTISFLSYLFRNKLNDKVFPFANILIIEKSESFGSGCLGKYGINTNTSAEGFVRLICTADESSKKGGLALSPNSKLMKISKNYEKKEEQSKIFYNNLKIKKPISPNKAKINSNNSDNEIKEFIIDKGYKINHYKPLQIFQDFYKLAPAQTLLKIGNRPAPLCLVGYFLECLGNNMLYYINNQYKKSLLLCNSEVKSIKSMKNDEYLIVVNNSNTLHNIKSKAVILATGGRQKTTNKMTIAIKNIVGEKNFFLSDYILQEQGFKLFTNSLFSRNKKRVIIIGGSHSGFSCAWILINQPSSYKNILISDPNLTYYTKFNKDCESCTQNKSFCCFGRTKDKNWDISHDELSMINTINNEIEVLILYRDYIKVHYQSEQDAINDNYTIYEKKNAVNKNGNVFPFIGLRGDSKELYRNIVNGNEKRVILIKADSWEEQKKIISHQECSVIWACGYETQNIPIIDAKGNVVDLNCTDDGGMYEVDKELRILDKNKNPFRNFYGIGQGYATFSIEMVGGKKARADAINLYNTYVAKKLYKSLMGLFSKLFIEYNEKKRFNNNEKENKLQTIDILSVKRPSTINLNSTKKNELIKNISINTLTNTEREKMNLSTTENMKNQMNIITNFGKIKSLISHKEKINYSIPESVEKNRHNNYGLNNRKFDIKINFNNTEIEEKNEKIMNINTQNKKFSFKDKKEYSENLRIILKKS